MEQQPKFEVIQGDKTVSDSSAETSVPATQPTLEIIQGGKVSPERNYVIDDGRYFDAVLDELPKALDEFVHDFDEVIPRANTYTDNEYQLVRKLMTKYSAYELAKMLYNEDMKKNQPSQVWAAFDELKERMQQYAAAQYEKSYGQAAKIDQNSK